MHLIELARVRAWIGSAEILHDVRLTMDAGEIYGFLGPNGAGKSTTIAVVTGLIPSATGSIAVLNADPRKNPSAIHASCGVLPERNGFYEWMSASDYLGLFACLYGRKLDERAIGDRLTQVGLDPGRETPIAGFSHGMKQRLGLARSLINDPRLLILDEPTNGLDPRGRREIHDLLIRLSEDAGVGILLCTHLLDDVERLCHRIGIISLGRTLIEGDLAEIAASEAASQRYRVRLAAAVPDREPPEGVRVTGREGDWAAVEIAMSMPVPEAWRALFYQGWPIAEIHRDGGGLEELYLNLTEGAAECTGPCF